MSKNKYFAVLLSMASSIALLCSCDNTKPPEEGTYNVVSGGTSITVTEEKSPDYNTPSFTFDNMTTHYGYYQLSDKEKEIYDQTVENLSRFEPHVPLDCDAKTFEKILELIRIEQLSFSQVVDRSIGEFDSDTQKYNVDIEYRFTPVQIEQMNFEVQKKADEIMQGITDDMNDYQKLKYFHDYLIINCESSTDDEYGDTMYGTLIRKKALCEGYAKTFSYLCNRAGIPNIIVTGYTGVAHMWNMVQLDGKWYHIDVTLDSPDARISEYFPDLILYQYFLTTDDVVENYREIYTNLFAPPNAEDTSMTYFNKENFAPDDYDDTLQILNKILPNVKAKNKHYMMLKFGSNDMYFRVYGLLTKPDENGKCVIDYYSAQNQIQITMTDYYSMDRIILFVFSY